MKLTDLNNPKYIAFETFKKSGDAVNTPLWAVEEDEKLYAWTSGSSWKVKRVRNNENVRVAASNSQGKPNTEWIDAKARIIDDAAAEEKMRGMLAKKYGFAYRIIRLMQSFRGGSKDPIVIEIYDK